MPALVRVPVALLLQAQVQAQARAQAASLSPPQHWFPPLEHLLLTRQMALLPPTPTLTR